MCFSHWFHAGSFGRHWKNYGWRQSIQGSGVGRQLLTLSNWSTLNTVQLWRLKSHCVTLAQNSAVSLVAIVTFRCYWFGEILEMKHCKGWWVGHPAQSQSHSPWWCWRAKIVLFLIYEVFCSPNVTWYFIAPWSFLAIHHPELQVKTGTHFKKLSLLACLHILLNLWRAMNVAQAGFLTINYTCPCWGQEVGKDSIHPAETSGPPEQDGHVQAPCWEMVQVSPPHQCLWLQQRYIEDEVGLAYKVVWRRYSGIPLFCKIIWRLSVLEGHLEFFRKELFCYINKNCPCKKVNILLLAPCSFIHDLIQFYTLPNTILYLMKGILFSLHSQPLCKERLGVFFIISLVLAAEQHMLYKPCNRYWRGM